jgi:hypothetical protein
LRIPAYLLTAEDANIQVFKLEGLGIWEGFLVLDVQQCQVKLVAKIGMLREWLSPAEYAQVATAMGVDPTVDL